MMLKFVYSDGTYTKFDIYSPPWEAETEQQLLNDTPQAKCYHGEVEIPTILGLTILIPTTLFGTVNLDMLIEAYCKAYETHQEYFYMFEHHSVAKYMLHIAPVPLLKKMEDIGVKFRVGQYLSLVDYSTINRFVAMNMQLKVELVPQWKHRNRRNDMYYDAVHALAIARCLPYPLCYLLLIAMRTYNGLENDQVRTTHDYTRFGWRHINRTGELHSTQWMGSLLYNAGFVRDAEFVREEMGLLYQGSGSHN